MKEYLAIFLNAIAVGSAMIFLNSILTTLILIATLLYWIRQHQMLNKKSTTDTGSASSPSNGSTASPDVN